MYLQNKYTKCYYNIVSRAKSRELPAGIYSEKHHIIPRSLGGNNSKNNIVSLTGREHYICHLLLTKMTVGKDKIKMVHAAWRMCCRGKDSHRDYKITSSIYENLKIKHSEYLKSRKGPDHPLFGKKTGRTSEDFTSAWKENISNSCKGRVPWNKGKERTQEVKDAVSSANKGRIPWNKGISRRWVNNGYVNKLVLPDAYLDFIKTGWCPGRI